LFYLTIASLHFAILAIANVKVRVAKCKFAIVTYLNRIVR